MVLGFDTRFNAPICMGEAHADIKVLSSPSHPAIRKLRRPPPTPISSRLFSFRRNATQEGDTAGPSRPPPRGSTHPSRHHLEPNPFEQSFSHKPANQRSASPESNKKTGKHGKKAGHKATKSEGGVKQEGPESDETSSKAVGNATNKDTTSNANQTPSKRILPPVSSIASPAPHETTSMQYPWSSALTGSLRSGPLSPAMLAGPQSTFDVSSFRSGFTPDLSNFKTGLTPLGSSTSFPPPSPNTAAFLAMVTNSGAGGLSGATITPNTLSALSGNPMDSHAQNHAMLASHSGHNGDGKGIAASHQGGGGDHQSDQFDFAFSRSMQDTPTKQHLPNSKLRNSTAAARGGSVEFADQTHQQQHPLQQQQQRDGNQQPTQTAPGLFLLSQAHQELSKREDAAAAAAAAAAAGQDGQATHGLNGQQLYNNSNVSNGKANNKAGNVSSSKRKKSAEPTTANTNKAVNGKKIKTGLTGVKVDEMTGLEEDGYESDELDEEGNRKQKSSNGDGGDDEEKRKNFLERNRQAALKCRQRKKAWLTSLQAKVEYLQSDNEGLQSTVNALRNEVMFLKTQLMQSQRQLGGPPVGLAPNPIDASNGPAPALGRNSVSGPVPIQGAGMAMSHNMPSQSPQHQQNNINAMAAAAAAAAAAASNSSNNNPSQSNSNVNNRMNGGNGGGSGNVAQGQYANHAMSRPTHMPGQSTAPTQQQFASPHQKGARQLPPQAA